MERSRFDDALDSLNQRRNEALATGVAVVRDMPGLLGLKSAQTTTVQTWRAPDGTGTSQDTVFVEITGAEGIQRIVLTPKVTAMIARQRDALTVRSRRRAATRKAADAKARGVVPFQRKGESRA
jgi:hypothetical protein